MDFEEEHLGLLQNIEFAIVSEYRADQSILDMFFVEMESSVAVDLGCAYKLHMDDAGFSVLRVTAGWVSLEWGGRESAVPAGAICRSRPRIGPGTPYFDDASESLQRALTAFDFKQGRGASIRTTYYSSMPSSLTR